MIIADTSIWIEFLKGNDPYFKKFISLIEQNKILGIECIFSELLQGSKNKRERSIILNYWNNIPKIDESGIWIRAGLISSEKKFLSKGIGLIDTVIFSVGNETDSKIWTLDKKLKNAIPKQLQFDFQDLG